jgi:hypothetical protein
MYCYVCAHGNKETPAIGVCMVCGMLVCKDHLIRADVEQFEYIQFGAKSKKKLPRILCQECYNALSS